MKTPEEIKKKLSDYANYYKDGRNWGREVLGTGEIMADALAYIRQLEVQVGADKNVPAWISTKAHLPETSDVVLVIASGKPRPNVELRDAYLIASYWADEGWIADGFEGWDALDVSYWMYLPEEPWRRAHD